MDGARIGNEKLVYHMSSTADGGVPCKGINGTLDGRDPEKIKKRISKNKDRPPTISQGRWPANFVLVHCPECERVGTERVKGSRVPTLYPESRTTRDVYGRYDKRSQIQHADPDGTETITAWNCHENCPARRLGEQSGERKSGGSGNDKAKVQGNVYGTYAERKGGQLESSNGTASRFFFQADWNYEVAERLATSDPVFYCAKASKGERNAGLDETFPLGDPPESGRRSKPAEGRKRALGRPRRNHHPTVKPIRLNEWLATLLLPPETYSPRRIFVPFAGSGSEMIGAMLAGWEEIVGVEMSEEYCEIAKARLEWWREKSKYRQIGMALRG